MRPVLLANGLIEIKFEGEIDRAEKGSTQRCWHCCSKTTPRRQNGATARILFEKVIPGHREAMSPE